MASGTYNLTSSGWLFSFKHCWINKKSSSNVETSCEDDDGDGDSDEIATDQKPLLDMSVDIQGTK